LVDAAHELIGGLPLDIFDDRLGILEHGQLLQGKGIVHFEVIVLMFFVKLMSNGQEMPSMRKLDMMNLFDSDFLEWSQFVIEDMEEPQFIDTAYSHVVAGGMEGQSNEGIVGLSVGLDLEIKHSEQFAPKRLVIPHSDRGVFVGTSCKERSLLTNVHPRNCLRVESLVKIFKVNFLLSGLLYDVRNLWNYLIQVKQRDVIICHRNQ
jgi:hypothetical protein